MLWKHGSQYQFQYPYQYLVDMVLFLVSSWYQHSIYPHIKYQSASQGMLSRYQALYQCQPVTVTVYLVQGLVQHIKHWYTPHTMHRYRIGMVRYALYHPVQYGMVYLVISIMVWYIQYRKYSPLQQIMFGTSFGTLTLMCMGKNSCITCYVFLCNSTV